MRTVTPKWRRSETGVRQGFGRFGLLLALAAFLWPGSAAAQQSGPDSGQVEAILGERRLALVIGNGAYASNPLRNPPSDASDVAAALKDIGFDVTLVLESDRSSMLRAMVDFGRAIKKGGVGLFYYAGHAVQVAGSNYLIPIGADLDNEEYVPIEAVDVNQILARMDAANNRLNIVILDACRDNPFARSFRSATRGLAQTLAPSGTFVAYATAPGDVAADGIDRNSPYTEALLAALEEPGRKLEEVFKRVRAEVKEKTDGQQTPWTGSSITGDFYFRPPKTGSGAPSADYRSRDLVAWQAIKNSNQPLDFRTFLETYPESALAPFARSRLAELEAELVEEAAADEPIVARLTPQEQRRPNEVRSWQTTSILEGHEDGSTFAMFSPDGAKVVTGSWGGTVRLWDAASGAALATLGGHTNVVWSMAFSPDGAKVVSASSDGTARLWDVTSGTALVTFQGHEGVVMSATFSPDGAKVVTASWDHTARLWDAASGMALATLQGHSDVVWSAAFSPDGAKVVTASFDGTARLWDAASGTVLATLGRHDGGVLSAAFSPDGARVVTASEDGIARLWDAASSTPLAVLQGHAGGIPLATFSPDGARVATASHDNTARLWDAASGRVLATLRGHDGSVLFTAFSPDGAKVVTASWDGTARIWDAARGTTLATLQGHEANVYSAAFSPDGAQLVTASRDGTARIWQLAPASVASD